MFQLCDKGIELIEIAPGIDLKKDILDQMEFTPIVREPLRLMDASIFQSGLMKLRQRNFGGSLDMESRVFADVANQTMYVDLYNVTVNSLADIETIESYLKKFIADNFAGGKVHAVGTYDSFDVHPELSEEYLAMQKRLGEHYLSVRRYSAGVFRRHKVAEAFGMDSKGQLKTPSLPGQAADEISCDQLLEYARVVGLSSSPEALTNAFVEMNGENKTMLRSEVPALLRKLLPNEPGRRI